MKLTRHELPMRTLPSGHALGTPLLHLQGERPGKKVYIQSGNHGGELAGHGAIWELCALLQDEELHGTLCLLPAVNPVSLDQKVGDWQVGVFDLVTGSNWNRVFKLLARVGGDDEDPRVDVAAFASAHRDAPWADVKAAFQARLRDAVAGLRRQLSERGIDYRDHFALSLQEWSCDADLVLDLHTGDVAPLYLYVPPWRPEAMRAFDIPHILVLNDRFAGAMDEATICPWTMLQQAFAAAGREIPMEVEGYTVELGSLETVTRGSMEADAARLANVLRAHGVLRKHPRRDAAIPRFLSAIEDYHTHVAPASGIAVWEKGPGSPVRSGERVATILQPARLTGLDVRSAEAPVVSRDDGILVTRHMSPVVYEGLPLFKVMSRVERIS